MHAWCLGRSEEGVGFPGNGVMGSCKLSFGFWKLNPGPQPQQVLLTAKLSLQVLAYESHVPQDLTAVICLPQWTINCN